jgi:hypothetical protein
MRFGEWRRMRPPVDRTVALLEAQGLPALTPGTVTQGPWYTEKRPG